MTVATIPSKTGIPLGGGLSPEAQAYGASIIAAGSSIDGATLNAVDEFITSGKRDGWWTPVLDCGLFVGGDLTGALVKLKSASGTGANLTNSGVLTTDYTQKLGVGFSSNASKWLGTGVDLSVLGLKANAMSFGVMQLDPLWDGPYTSSGFLMGLNQASLETPIIAGRSISIGGIGAAGGGYSGGRVFQAISFNASGTGVWSFDGTRGSISPTDPSAVTDLTTELTIFKCKRSGTTYYCPGRVGFYFVGNSMTQAQMNALGVALQTFNLRIGRVPPGDKALFFGDSITAGQLSTTTPKNTWAYLTAQGIGSMQYNCGAPSSLVVSDATNAYSFTNRYADVLTIGAPKVFVMGGTNDLGADVAANGNASLSSAYTTSLTTILNALKAAGSKVICVGMPQRTSANATKMTLWNAATAAAARAAGVPFVDIVGAMNDTGTPATFLNADGIHPIDVGHALIAARAIEADQGRLMRYTPLTFGAVAANTSVDVTLTMYGVSLGSGTGGTKQTEVTVTPYTGVVAGLTFSAFVSADDTVKIRCTNSTVGSITPTAGAYYNVTAYL